MRKKEKLFNIRKMPSYTIIFKDLLYVKKFGLTNTLSQMRSLEFSQCLFPMIWKAHFSGSSKFSKRGGKDNNKSRRYGKGKRNYLYLNMPYFNRTSRWFERNLRLSRFGNKERFYLKNRFHEFSKQYFRNSNKEFRLVNSVLDLVSSRMRNHFKLIRSKTKSFARRNPSTWKNKQYNNLNKAYQLLERLTKSSQFNFPSIKRGQLEAVSRAIRIPQSWFQQTLRILSKKRIKHVWKGFQLLSPLDMTVNLPFCNVNVREGFFGLDMAKRFQGKIDLKLISCKSNMHFLYLMKNKGMVSVQATSAFNILFLQLRLKNSFQLFSEQFITPYSYRNLIRSLYFLSWHNFSRVNIFYKRTQSNKQLYYLFGKDNEKSYSNVALDFLFVLQNKGWRKDILDSSRSFLRTSVVFYLYFQALNICLFIFECAPGNKPFSAIAAEQCYKTDFGNNLNAFMLFFFRKFLSCMRFFHRRIYTCKWEVNEYTFGGIVQRYREFGCKMAAVFMEFFSFYNLIGKRHIINGGRYFREYFSSRNFYFVFLKSKSYMFFRENHSSSNIEKSYVLKIMNHITLFRYLFVFKSILKKKRRKNWRRDFLNFRKTSYRLSGFIVHFVLYVIRKLFVFYLSKYFVWVFQKIVQRPVKVYFFFMAPKTVNAQVVVRHLVTKLRFRHTLNASLYPVIRELRRYKNIVAYKLLFAGRFTRKQRATFLWKCSRSGGVSYSGYMNFLDYSSAHVKLRFGLCNVKVWLKFSEKPSFIDVTNRTGPMFGRLFKFFRKRDIFYKKTLFSLPTSLRNGITIKDFMFSFFESKHFPKRKKLFGFIYPYVLKKKLLRSRDRIELKKHVLLPLAREVPKTLDSYILAYKSKTFFFIGRVLSLFNRFYHKKKKKSVLSKKFRKKRKLLVNFLFPFWETRQYKRRKRRKKFYQKGYRILPGKSMVPQLSFYHKFIVRNKKTNKNRKFFFPKIRKSSKNCVYKFLANGLNKQT